MARQALTYERSTQAVKSAWQPRKIVMARTPAGKHGGASATDESSG
jgi:hypothetical protein